MNCVALADGSETAGLQRSARNCPQATGCTNASGAADLAGGGVVLTAGADEAFGTRGVSMVEPRVPCPRCGAHVLIEARAVDHVSLVCPVCGLKWDAPKRKSE